MRDRKHLDNILRIQKRENINTPQNDETGDDDNVSTDVTSREHEHDFEYEHLPVGRIGCTGT